MDDLTTERRLDLKALWVIEMHCLFVDMLSIGICTTRHWRTSGRLVQELNVCTVSLYLDVKDNSLSPRSEET